MIFQPQIAVAAIACMVGITVGAVVNGWRINAEHQIEIRRMNEHAAELTLAIERQNASMRQLQVAASTAMEERRQSEKLAADLISQNKRRGQSVTKLAPEDCGKMIVDVWSLAQ